MGGGARSATFGVAMSLKKRVPTAHGRARAAKTHQYCNVNLTTCSYSVCTIKRRVVRYDAPYTVCSCKCNNVVSYYITSEICSSLYETSKHALLFS
jgi:hypothetical protein